MEKKRVGIVLFENIEVLDFCGPFEVFSVTRLNEEKRWEESSPFEVLLIAEKSTGKIEVSKIGSGLVSCILSSCYAIKQYGKTIENRIRRCTVSCNIQRKREKEYF